MRDDRRHIIEQIEHWWQIGAPDVASIHDTGNQDLVGWQAMTMQEITVFRAAYEVKSDPINRQRDQRLIAFTYLAEKSREEQRAARRSVERQPTLSACDPGRDRVHRVGSNWHPSRLAGK